MSEQAQHTPGPWQFQTVRTSVGLCHKVGLFPYKPGKLNSACIYVDYPGGGSVEAELLANAHLMAAAPDLLSALENLVASVNDGAGGAVDDARAAIAKARGQS